MRIRPRNTRAARDAAVLAASVSLTLLASIGVALALALLTRA